jgi:glucuronate isomerase
MICLRLLARILLAHSASCSSQSDYLAALKNRHDFFATMGCNVSDHGLEEIYAEEFSEAEIDTIFVPDFISPYINYGR